MAGPQVTHPTHDDEVTTEGLLHIANCAECQQTHGEQETTYAKSVYWVMDRYTKAIQQEGTT